MHIPKHQHQSAVDTWPQEPEEHRCLVIKVKKKRNKAIADFITVAFIRCIV